MLLLGTAMKHVVVRILVEVVKVLLSPGSPKVVIQREDSVGRTILSLVP